MMDNDALVSLLDNLLILGSGVADRASWRTNKLQGVKLFANWHK